MKKMIVTLLQRTQVLLGATLLLVLVIAVFYILVFRTIQLKTHAYTELATQTQTQIDSFYDISRQKKLINETAAEREQLASYFVSENSVGNLFERLEEIAEISGVVFSVSSARVGNDKEGGLQIQVGADGQFSEVYHFLQLVETAPFGLMVDAFTLQANTGDDISDEVLEPWTGLFTITVVTYLK